MAVQYRRTERTKGGVEKRARQRLKRTGKIKGVNAKDGITGGEARRIKRTAIREGVLKPKAKQKQRSRRQEVDPFAREIDARTQLEFGPQERELQYQRDQSSQFSQNLQGWYSQHVRDLQLAQTAHQAFAQGVQQAQLQATQNAAASDAAQNASLTTQMQADAAKRGTTVDPNLLAQMQQGVAARQAMGNAGGALLGAQGQAQSAFLGNNVAVGGQQGLQAQQDEQARKRRLDQLAADLAADKGAYKVKARADLQEQQHTQRLENAAFGLEQAETIEGIRDKRADNRRQRADSRSLRRDRRIDNRRQRQEARERARHNREQEAIAREREARMRQNAAADRADDGKRNGSNFTPTQVRSGRRTLRNYISRGRSGADLPDSHDPLLARAAAQIIRNGGVDPQLARKIRRNYGFTPKIRRLTGSRGDSAGP